MRRFDAWTRIYRSSFGDCRKYGWLFGLYSVRYVLVWVWEILVLTLWGIPFSNSFKAVLNHSAVSQIMGQKIGNLHEHPGLLLEVGGFLALLTTATLLLDAFLDGVVYKLMLSGFRRKDIGFTWGKVFRFGRRYWRQYVLLKSVAFFFSLFVFLPSGVLVGTEIFSKRVSLPFLLFVVLLGVIFFPLSLLIKAWTSFSFVGVAENLRFDAALKKSWRKLREKRWWALKGLLAVDVLVGGSAGLVILGLDLLSKGTLFFHSFAFLFQQAMMLSLNIFFAAMNVRFWAARKIPGR